jgi:hypothetical protein
MSSVALSLLIHRKWPHWSTFPKESAVHGCSSSPPIKLPRVPFLLLVDRVEMLFEQAVSLGMAFFLSPEAGNIRQRPRGDGRLLAA